MVVVKKKELSLKVQQEVSLINFLQRELSSKFSLSLPRKTIDLFVANKKVKLNGKFISDSSRILKRGDHLNVFITKSEIREHSTEVVASIELCENSIIYEDSSIIILNKPSGVSSNATTDSSKDHMLAALKRFRPKEKYLSLHHRLDFETSGLLLFCKKKSLNKAISDLFEKRKIKKTYLAIIKTPNQEISPSFQVSNLLEKDSNNRMKMKSSTSSGKKAKTRFEKLKEENGFTLIKAMPETGRMHQIRVHLSELGLPIHGDSIYGNGKDFERTLLHAYSLEFTHPKTNEKLHIKCSAPNDFFITHLSN